LDNNIKLLALRLYNLHKHLTVLPNFFSCDFLFLLPFIPPLSLASQYTTLSRMTSRILHGKKILACGDFGQQISHEALRKWVEDQDGLWLTKYVDDITHLVTTREEWEKQSSTGLLDIQNHILA
jgi:hypothetical protein